MKTKELEVYSVSVDLVPDLVTREDVHEICDPGPLMAKEIVSMWDALKSAYLKSEADRVREVMLHAVTKFELEEARKKGSK